MAMTKRDYEVVAGVIAALVPKARTFREKSMVRWIAIEMGIRLKSSRSINGGVFDTHRFIAACCLPPHHEEET